MGQVAEIHSAPKSKPRVSRCSVMQVQSITSDYPSQGQCNKINVRWRKFISHLSSFSEPSVSTAQKRKIRLVYSNHNPSHPIPASIQTRGAFHSLSTPNAAQVVPRNKARIAIPARGKLYISHTTPFPSLRTSSSLRFNLRSPPTSCSECVVCCRSRSYEEGSLCSWRMVWSWMKFSSQTISPNIPFLPSHNFLP